MKNITFILLLLFWPLALIAEENLNPYENRDAAFYEGENWNYIIAPPAGFSMNQKDAELDGYSFAFVPDSERYIDASALIGVNIFKIRGMAFESVVRQDTLELRKHYGKTARIWEVDSVITGTLEPTTTFYLNDPERFLPNVMISYVDGGTELLVFELIISESALRRNAEDAFLDCLKNTRLLARGELGQR